MHLEPARTVAPLWVADCSTYPAVFGKAPYPNIRRAVIMSGSEARRIAPGVLVVHEDSKALFWVVVRRNEICSDTGPCRNTKVRHQTQPVGPGFLIGIKKGVFSGG